MTILVTGSAGHLGEALMRRFRADGRAVRGMDIKATPWTDIVGSITDRALVREAVAGCTAIINAAALHKPHVDSHTKQSFLDVNIQGTLILLEAGKDAGIRAFVQTSTTSTFGAALSPAAGEPAAWITEAVVPVPKNIYGVTKTAAEDLCALFARKEGVPALVLRTSRFFPEEDDDGAVSARYDVLNHQANELLYRRADIDDLVTAHALAVELAPRIGFDRLILSATTPFGPEHLADLRRDAAGVVRQLFPEAAALYAARGWTLPAEIDRVYVNDRARRVLGWAPVRDFRFALDALSRGEDFRSPLARAVGRKGYHDRPMPPYTTA
ncbi:MAG: hypothetical protein RLY86_1622 [Pseudomonadota bacterium]|jgi:UDP-glucose 4-epimerase